MSRPLIGVSIGDPAGIGPEILVKAAVDDRVRSICRLVAVGDLDVMSAAVDTVGSSLKLRSVTSEQIVDMVPVDDSIPVLDTGIITGIPVRGLVKAEYGRASYEYIINAIDLALKGRIAAVVTNPINKAALAAAGIPHAGHTEIFAAETGTSDYAMMIAHGSLRAVHVSTHISLREACDRATKDRVLAVIRLAAGAVNSLEETAKPIGVCGLNPHSGEGGLFGTEEIDQIIPAIEQAGVEGINVEGPLPPDTAFPRALGGEFSAIVAMYHDQGHIPLKLAGFKVNPVTGGFGSVNGVNITLGLPIIRTSVDHGTAFDLAGTGKASHESLVEAIEYAVRLHHGSRNPKP